MITVELELERLEKKDQAQEYLAKQFGFPDYYGRNLDALHDCLEDCKEPVRILLKGQKLSLGEDMPAIPAADGGYAGKVLQVFRDLAGERPGQFRVELLVSV